MLFFASAWTNRTSGELKPEADPETKKVNLNKSRFWWMFWSMNTFAWSKRSKSKVTKTQLFSTNAGIRGEAVLQAKMRDTESAVPRLSNRPKETEQAKVSRCTFVIPPWMFWVLTCLLTQPGLYAGEKTDPALVTSIFTPESAPAHSIVHLAHFVLAITAMIFAVVFSLIIYVVARFRRRSNDDGKEPAQVYGSNPVETAWTVLPLIIVVVLTVTTARVIHEIQDPRKPSGEKVKSARSRF